MIYYNPQMIDRLRYRFPGSDTIPRNFSQAGQDLFVLSMLNGLKNGTYIEIGSATPEELSNTVLLERYYDWRGVGVDIVPAFVDQYNANRINKTTLSDATTTDYVKLLRDAGIEGNIIDYLSCDCEPPAVTFAALQQVIEQDIHFSIITFEHETYTAGTEYRDLSRDYLRSKGYELVVSNISAWPGAVFEDWWAHPALVDADFIKLFKADDDSEKLWSNYIYPC